MPGTPRRRLLALAALILALAAMAQLVALAIVAFPSAALALALVALGLASALYGVVRRGVVHVLGLIAGASLLVVFLAMMIADRPGLVLGALAALGSV